MQQLVLVACGMPCTLRCVLAFESMPMLQLQGSCSRRGSNVRTVQGERAEQFSVIMYTKNYLRLYVWQIGAVRRHDECDRYCSYAMRNFGRVMNRSLPHVDGTDSNGEAQRILPV